MEKEPIIQNALGVCSAEEDTRLLARVSAQVGRPGGRALDLGAGTGYVACYLALQGMQVDATDVSTRALELTRRNVERNGIAVRIFYSNLFSHVEGEYDVIAFNPPMNPQETEVSRWITSFLRRHQGVANLLMGVFDRFFTHSRLDFLVNFLQQARRHLAPGGHIVMEMTRLEIDELAGRLPDFAFGPRFDIPRLPSEQIVVISPKGEPAS